MEHPLKISVITVCFNAVETIERTICSVLSQSYPNIEYIIVDGVSTDGTLEIIKKYSSRISKFVSEKDNGIYDAMNKGVALASGDIIHFLNADDRFCDDNVVSDIVKVFQENNAKTVVYGNVIRENIPETNKFRHKKQFQFKSANDFLFNYICQQTIFARMELFSHVGNFDCRYKMVADTDWVIRAFKYRPSGFYYVDRDIVHYNFIGRSHQQASTTIEEYAWIRIRRIFTFKSWFFIRYVFLRAVKKRLFNEKW